MPKTTAISKNAKTVLELDNFNPMRAELESFANERKELKIKNFEDKEGYELVRKSRIELKNKRVEIEKERVRIVAQPNEFVSKINEEAKILKNIIETVEKDLQKQEKEYEDEKERIKREKEEAEQKKVQDRMNKLAEWDYRPDYIFVKMLEDDKFEEILGQAKAAYEQKKQQEKEAAEKAEKEAEEQKKLAIKNEALSNILKAENLDILEMCKDFIKTNGLDFADFESDFNAKKVALEEAKKLEAERIKQQEEKQKLLEEKIALANEKIAAFKTLEELNNYFNGFADSEYVQDKLLDAYNKRKNELLEEEKAKTAAAAKAPDRVV